MNFQHALVAATLAAGLMFASTPGMAANTGSFSVLKEVGAPQPSAVQKTWGWHRTCRRGLHGWHKHVKGIGRVQCTNHVCRHGKCRWF
jgi:hypothetical protein